MAKSIAVNRLAKSSVHLSPSHACWQQHFLPLYCNVLDGCYQDFVYTHRLLTVLKRPCTGWRTPAYLPGVLGRYHGWRNIQGETVPGWLQDIVLRKWMETFGWWSKEEGK